MSGAVRVVGGRLKGRPLKVPGRGSAAGRALRPTADRVRESLFNVLAHGIEDFDIAGATVVDVRDAAEFAKEFFGAKDYNVHYTLRK